MNIDSSKFPFIMKNEISPLIMTKFTNFPDSSFSSSRKNCFISNDTPKFFHELNKSVSTLFPPFTDFHLQAKFNYFEHNSFNSSSVSNKTTHAGSFPSLKFTSEIFKKNSNDLLTKKRKRIKLKSIKDMSRILISLNEVQVNGFYLKNFPFIQCENDILQVNILKRITNKKKFFDLVKRVDSLICYQKGTENDDSNINNSNSDSNSNNYPNFSIQILKDKNICFYNNETNSKKILTNFYSDIKRVLILIESNYIKKIHKVYNEKNILKLELLIRNCNMFTDFLLKETRYKKKKIFLEKKENLTFPSAIFKKFTPVQVVKEDKMNTEDEKVKEKKKQKYKGDFTCEFCHKHFMNGQSLGGHISQLHPNQSEKYRKKIEVRKRRTLQRNVVVLCKKDILSKYGFDYEKLTTNKKKEDIKRIISEHKYEYKRMLNEKKREIAMKNYILQ